MGHDGRPPAFLSEYASLTLQYIRSYIDCRKPDKQRTGDFDGRIVEKPLVIAAVLGRVFYRLRDT